ncbi:hypothetical protein TNCV_2207021 [Trichonephila clavipes]|uniref:Uncharacterized protein n=1 Tax=Trichonephila clavipes TaxID=2585209 RepID=A0A8X6SB53_TRICX|nr:hypothetical protein TNCV_2207021 [Trichonephila clavipes]
MHVESVSGQNSHVQHGAKVWKIYYHRCHPRHLYMDENIEVHEHRFALVPGQIRQLSHSVDRKRSCCSTWLEKNERMKILKITPLIRVKRQKLPGVNDRQTLEKAISNNKSPIMQELAETLGNGRETAG